MARRVLVVSRYRLVGEAISRYLRGAGFEVRWALGQEPSSEMARSVDAVVVVEEEGALTGTADLIEGVRVPVVVVGVESERVCVVEAHPYPPGADSLVAALRALPDKDAAGHDHGEMS